MFDGLDVARRWADEGVEALMLGSDPHVVGGVWIEVDCALVIMDLEAAA